MKRRLFLMVMMVMVTGFRVAEAGPTFLNVERFGYAGSWTRYSSLADAMSGMNPVEVGTMPQRDFTAYISQDVSDNPFDPEFDLLTNWYSGTSNPSNTNYGFLQHYDADASTVTALNSYWSSDLTEFTLTASASGADYANDFARFGERPGGPGSATEAYFHSLEVDLTISDLTASYNSTLDRYEGTDTGSSMISGSLTGIVENVGTDSSRHGFYAYELDLNNSSWAYDNGHVDAGQLTAYSSSVVPEPSSMALVVTSFPIGLIWLRKRRKRQERKQAA